MEDNNGGDDATRMGRFRVCPPNTPGPPEMTHGRFRISPQSKYSALSNLSIFPQIPR